MRLKDWLKENNRTQGWLAERLGVSQQSISSYCRECFDPLFVDPSAAVKHGIWHETNGQVCPNDFYGLPLVRRVMRHEDLYSAFASPLIQPAMGGGRCEGARPEHTKGSCFARGEVRAVATPARTI